MEDEIKDVELGETGLTPRLSRQGIACDLGDVFGRCTGSIVREHPGIRASQGQIKELRITRWMDPRAPSYPLLTIISLE